jgi:hypothetical protein
MSPRVGLSSRPDGGIYLPSGIPRPPAEIPACTNTLTLAPRFREAVFRALQRMRQLGHDPVIAETLRTNERQQYLFGFGRDYDDGRGVVTHSRNADETWHAFGLAVDVISQSRGWGAPEEFWRDLEAGAKAQGLVSGRDWDGDAATKEEFIDSPHIQWGKPMRRSPSPRAARLFAQGGYQAVWREVGAAA